MAPGGGCVVTRLGRRPGRQLALLCIAAIGLASSACSSAPTSKGPVSVFDADVGKGEHGLVAWVADSFTTTSHTVVPVCLSSGRAGPPIPVGVEPIWISVAPDGRDAYVANSGLFGSRPQQTVTPIDLETGRPGRPIKAGVGPIGIAITPNGRAAYIPDMGTGGTTGPRGMVDAYTVAVLDLETNSLRRLVRIGPGPGSVAVTPDGRTVLVGVDGTIENPKSVVIPIDVATGRIGRPIRVGVAPMGMAISPNGKVALVTNTGWGDPFGDTVTPIDLRTMKPLRSIKVGDGPINVTMTPDGSKAFIANSEDAFPFKTTLDGTVTPIDVATLTALPPIRVPGSSQAVAITPDGRTVWSVDLVKAARGTRTELVPIDARTDDVGKPIDLPINGGAIAIFRTPPFERGWCH